MSKPGWKPGQSGNPGGRPKLAAAWELATGGKRISQVTAEALRLVWERALEGPNGSEKGDADWRFSVQKVLDYSAGPPKQEIEVSGAAAQPRLDPATMTDAEIAAALDAIALLRKLGVEPDEDNAGTEH